MGKKIVNKKLTGGGNAMLLNNPTRVQDNQSFPDMSVNGINCNINVEITANRDGWLLFTVEAAYDNRTYLKVNNKVFGMVGNNGSVTTRAAIPVPISKGDKYIATGGSLVFYPCRGVR